MRSKMDISVLLALFPWAWMNNTLLHQGAGVAEVLLVGGNCGSGKVDLGAYDDLVDDQIAHGVQGLIVGGTTGEGQLMSWDEHIMMIAHTVNTFGNRIKVRPDCLIVFIVQRSYRPSLCDLVHLLSHVAPIRATSWIPASLTHVEL
jgi:Dihydrodipicolinate synthetase family